MPVETQLCVKGEQFTVTTQLVIPVSPETKAKINTACLEYVTALTRLLADADAAEVSSM